MALHKPDLHQENTGDSSTRADRSRIAVPLLAGTVDPQLVIPQRPVSAPVQEGDAVGNLHSPGICSGHRLNVWVILRRFTPVKHGVIAYHPDPAEPGAVRQ
jgi:hypothetical protein